MKVKENSSTAVPLAQSDSMDKTLYTGFSDPRDGVDPRMNVLGEEGLQHQDPSNNLTIGTQCGADSSIASSMGEFDVGVMPVIYDECERNRETTSRNITLAGDSSGDETFAAEMMSPCVTSYSSHEMTSPLQWSSNRLERSRHIKRRNRPSHVVGATSDIRSYDQNSDQRRCNRFLSSETIVSDCHSEENAQSVQYQPINYSRAGSRHTSGEYSSNGNVVKEISSNPFGNSFEPAPASGSSVMREIDLAVSLAHSRFKNVSPQSCDVLTNESDISPAFSTCDVHVTRKDNRRSSDAVIVLRTSQHADASSMTKNYASHNINARSAEDEWKRKSDYGGACPAVHELKATFKQSDVRESLGRRAIESSDHNVQNRERSRSAADVVSSESANNEQNGLAFETKITSDHDERNTASYAVGASLLHVQSSPHEAFWPRSRSRPSYEKQVLVRSSAKNGSHGMHHSEVLSNSEADNKPINLSLPQGKIRQGELDCEVSPQKIAKSSEFRKCAKSFSSREKRYQISKRRTRSQCSVSPTNSAPAPSFNREYVDSRSSNSVRQSLSHDMGIDNNRLLIDDYSKESASCINQGLTPDSNSSIFSPSEASHMMVQDESKTYAILSGRRNEEMMNSHMLSTSGSSIQQQSLFPQGRHSHSIINYVGHHVPSPDIRPSEMSPSPPVRDHRATPSSSLPGIASSSKAFHNVIVPNRHNHHSASPSSREDFHASEAFQRQYDNSHFDSALQDSRHHLHQHPSLAMAQHHGGSTFSPLHLPQSQQTQQFLMKHHQNLPPHSGLGTSSSMLPYPGSLRIPQHQGYLKPPPVDLDDLSEDERERMRVKRERNRVAAAKCRNRRRELLERLEKEAEQLEREQELLRENVRRLRVQKLQLGNMLEEHETSCQKKVEETGGNSPPKATDGSPNASFAGISTNDEQPTSGHVGGIEGGESSTTQNGTSPVQLSSQA